MAWAWRNPGDEAYNGNDTRRRPGAGDRANFIQMRVEFVSIDRKNQATAKTCLLSASASFARSNAAERAAGGRAGPCGF
jgi:hypothetical protein